jgi:hypothetical protein
MLDVQGWVRAGVSLGVAGRAGGIGEVTCTHTHVREDALQFGFALSEERRAFAFCFAFRLGRKWRSILSTMSIGELRTIGRHDGRALQSVPVGKNTADRLLELRQVGELTGGGTRGGGCGCARSGGDYRTGGGGAIPAGIPSC